MSLKRLQTVAYCHFFFESHGHLESISIETRKLLNINLMRLRTNKQSLYLVKIYGLCLGTN